jgi:DHA2 family multidrug resistance protein
MVNTSWERETRYVHSELAGLTDQHGVATQAMQSSGMSLGQVRGTMDWLLQQQSVMVATNQLFILIAVIFVFAACMIWFAPRPKNAADISAAH